MKNAPLRSDKLRASAPKKGGLEQLQLGLPGAEDVVRIPFLKWAGRKTRVLPVLKPLLPKEGRRLIEPFVGSGAVFLNTDYPRAVLADSNADLIHLFEVLRDSGEQFIRECGQLFGPDGNQEEKFYKLREEFNKCCNKARRAAIFIYLNRHCFNGLCRYNAKGNFNTPFGRYEKPYFPAAEMRAFSAKLGGAQLHVQDFRTTLAMAGRGDVVYCDPPYLPLSATANFTAYAAGGFGPEAQRDLATACEAAAGRGATVMISNHDTEFGRQIYAGADRIVSLMVARMISCDGANRNKAKELIAVYRART